MEPNNTAEVERMKEAGDVEGLIEALSYRDDVSVRRTAAEALGQVGGVQAAESLVGALRDPDESVRSAAAQALGNCRDADAAKLLQGIMDDPNENIRRAGIEAAIHLAGRRTGARSGQQAPKSSQVLPVKVGFFLLGGVLWCIPLLFFSLSGKFLPLLYVGLVLVVFLLILGMKGWDIAFVDKHGNPGQFYKFGVILLLAGTGIGLLPIFYWTGKGLLRWIYKYS